MKYYVAQSANDNVAIASEWEDLVSAKMAYHNLCAAFWNESSVIEGVIGLLDSHLELIPGYKEYIFHPASEE